MVDCHNFTISPSWRFASLFLYAALTKLDRLTVYVPLYYEATVSCEYE